MKIVLAGYPKTGKTTLAQQLGEALGTSVYHTDDTIELGTHDDSQEVSRWFDKPGDWIVEGVIAPRAIRKWLEQHPGERFPADVVVYSREHKTAWANEGTFVKGLDTVWKQIEGGLPVMTEAALLQLLRRSGVQVSG